MTGTRQSNLDPTTHVRGSWRTLPSVAQHLGMIDTLIPVTNHVIRDKFVVLETCPAVLVCQQYRWIMMAHVALCAGARSVSSLAERATQEWQKKDTCGHMCIATPHCCKQTRTQTYTPGTNNRPQPTQSLKHTARSTSPARGLEHASNVRVGLLRVRAAAAALLAFLLPLDVHAEVHLRALHRTERDKSALKPQARDERRAHTVRPESAGARSMVTPRMPPPATGSGSSASSAGRRCAASSIAAYLRAQSADNSRARGESAARLSMNRGRRAGGRRRETLRTGNEPNKANEMLVQPRT